MTYSYPDLVKVNPGAAQVAANVGKFSVNRMLVEVPDNTQFEGPMPPPLPRGLGDIIASVAKPIARGIDRVTGTNIQNCGGCAKRQTALNQAFPIDKNSTA